MNLKIAARMIAVLALVAAMTAAFMVLRGDGSQDASSPRFAHPGGEPARAELDRCRNIGMAAIADAACRKAWVENRRRFLQPTSHVSPYAATSVDKDQSRLLPEQSPASSYAQDHLRPDRVAP
ncbi:MULTISPECIES: putative entry exclusion protein TrbK-alt [unclassified Mesorhizobium]|uniref:putative entry exclusion protein TrbK-alt n=1 Tax=unclassified Mesorhizobium TaxID=325217 RepID=UPI000F74C67D|nr:MULTISPECIES: putative entry exclusion protein TrbK-alt [unclassified Mesorhizobium]AZO05120.1 conjugal transfer protein TrbK [Mesorhizobium sp. M2A.F.Ca.ET.043.02.1.1]RWB42912.1 MAG: conjugal transfer protein TrbK [Mesorhizobium sp.]RWB88124.1 MAG: conjugal transfer protein TrbK [Mesorhizobium sp.]RWD77339.1 MAG: conjugal transfer protein TrbK [Mesorhizobium sp.]TIU68329.1 MAG: conjugal transfer protein TrbK [Mesorhizobium sp.]